MFEHERDRDGYLHTRPDQRQPTRVAVERLIELEDAIWGGCAGQVNQGLVTPRMVRQKVVRPKQHLGDTEPSNLTVIGRRRPGVILPTRVLGGPERVDGRRGGSDRSPGSWMEGSIAIREGDETIKPIRHPSTKPASEPFPRNLLWGPAGVG
jgi:hypothetical protein